jgi:hypothetical protein
LDPLKQGMITDTFGEKTKELISVLEAADDAIT